jgi:poly(3-hydroxybutyrate) depolymerase
MHKAYQFVDFMKRVNQPTVQWLDLMVQFLQPLEKISPVHRLGYAQAVWWRDALKIQPKPSFGLDRLHLNGTDFPVLEQVVHKMDYMKLLKFSLEGVEERPRLLIAAPLSGHYATLLRDTVKRALYSYDVWITDWENARDVPAHKPDFHLHTYVDYMIECMQFVKKSGDFHMMAVCQPTVPVVAALTYMEQSGDIGNLPQSVALLGGPLDTRCSPTEVNQYAEGKKSEWFKQYVIDVVPPGYRGAGREVYPGYLQHMGFVAMNTQKHAQAHLDFFEHLLSGAELSVEKHQKFYDEYNAVMDLPAPYYLETLEHIFFDQKLVKGTFRHKKVELNLKEIRHVAVMTIEGTLDDISGPGQTHAIQSQLSKSKGVSHCQRTYDGVGHYGIFSGKSWRERIFPDMDRFFQRKPCITSKKVGK